MKDEDKLAYEQAISLKTYEGNLVWSRSGILLIVNTILLTAIGVFLSKDTPNKYVIWSLSFFGFSICII